MTQLRNPQIVHFVNGIPYNDEELGIQDYEYKSLRIAEYVLRTDLDCAEEAIMGNIAWIGNLTVKGIVNWEPGKELALLFSDGSIYKEILINQEE